MVEGSMQPGQQEADCVTVQFCAIDGAQQSLRCPRDASLGALQKRLCAAFRKPFPIRQAGLVLGGQAYHDFLDKPLANAEEGQSVTILFSVTTNMFYIDQCWPRLTKATTFEEDMREP